MKILVDISHPAHLNFFKNAIQLLKEEKHDVIITALNRGKLPNILLEELNGFSIKLNGRHRGGKWSIIFEANILRFLQQLRYVFSKKIDIAISCGSFTTGAIFKYILFKPNIQFDDDPERKVNVFLEKLTSTKLIFPPIYKGSNKIVIVNALKEWAYLSPDYFKPDPDVLQKYGISPKKYIFIREVSTASLNYKFQQSNLVTKIANKFPEKLKVILSLENKSTASQYPESWLILKEPVKDIHSLMYFSRLLISTGDSMAREGSMLGVPSIYCGERDMAANRIMIDKGMLFIKNIIQVPDFIQYIVNNKIGIEGQDNFRESLRSDWDDVTFFLIKQINKLVG